MQHPESEQCLPNPTPKPSESTVISIESTANSSQHAAALGQGCNISEDKSSSSSRRGQKNSPPKDANNTDRNAPQLKLCERDENPLVQEIQPHNLSFNLYQRQAVIYSESNVPPPPNIFPPRTVPLVMSTDPHQGQAYFNADQAQDFGPTNSMDAIHEPHYQTYNVMIPPPVFCGSGHGQCHEDGAQSPLQVKLPSWAKLDEDETSRGVPLVATMARGPSHPRLVEYVGDQYHEKNPHTRRTILLNQKRWSENDPIVFYRFYQFSCPCMGKVWFSPLHRARNGCFCRDCHQLSKPFGHIDGLTPYLGHELCYAKFQCHHCGRSWSCQKSRSNFPDNCFTCGTIVYPYYQVSHSVLRRKIMRQNHNTFRFRTTLSYSDSSSDALSEDEEDYLYHQGSSYFPTISDRSINASSKSLAALTSSLVQTKIVKVSSDSKMLSVQSTPSVHSSDHNPLERSVSDTEVVLRNKKANGERIVGLHHHFHRK